MPPRRACQKPTPKISPKSEGRVTRSGAPSSAAEDGHPEASPGDATEIGRTQMVNEDRDSKEAAKVETTPEPPPDVFGAPPEDAAELDGTQKGNEGQTRTCDAIVTDNANLSSGNSIDDDGAKSRIPKESDLGEEVAVDGEGNCIVNDSNLGEEVPVDDQKLGHGVDKDSCLRDNGVVEEENLGAGGSEGASEKDSGDVPQDQSNGEAVQDKNLTMNGDCNVQAKSLSGQDVDGDNGLDAAMKHDSNVVEDGDAAAKDEDQGNGLISDDEDEEDDDLSSNPGAEHDLVEEESPAAKTEGGDVVEEDGEEEEYDYEESENDGDNYEHSEEDGDDYEEGEDNEEKNEESKEDKSSSKSADLSEKGRMKGLEIHIGGIDKETVEDDLVKVFEKFGEIKSARIIRQSNRRAKGFAFVQYATAEQAKNAVSELKDGVEVRGKRVKVSSSWENATLFIDNICKSWTKEHVLNTLKDYGIGHIEEMHLPDDTENKGQSKGFAFLEFSTHMDAVAAHQRLGKADALFGCDRSAEVAFMRNQVPSSEDLTEIKAAISRRKGRLQKAEHGGSKVKKSSERKRPRPKTEAHAKSQGAEKERDRTHQASSSKSNGKGSGKKGKAVSEVVERKPTRPKILGSKSHRPNSRVTENRVARLPLRPTTTIGHKRKPLPLERDDRGKRKVGKGYDDRPSKNLRGNKPSTSRYAIRSPRRNTPRIRERPAHARSAISGSKRHHSDMEPHAGYVEPAALKRQARYHEPDHGNHSKRHLKYPEPDLGHRHQSHSSYLEPAFEGRHQGRVSYREPALETRYESRLSYREPALESRNQSRLSYREPALEDRYHEPHLVREALPHGGYLEPPARVQSHYDYRPRLRRDDDGYNNQISSSSTNPRALPSYAPSPRFLSYSRYEGDSSSRGGGYHHKSYLPRR